VKLFHQLTEAEKTAAIQACLELIIKDMIDGKFVFDAITEDEIKLKEKLDDAFIAIESFDTPEEKEEYLLCDEEVVIISTQIALDMARTGFYHSDEDLVIFTDTMMKSKTEDVSPTDDRVSIVAASEEDKKKNRMMN
jgi:hypothetical protein